MTDLKQHFSSRGAASSLLTSRFSKHPERYLEIFRVLRKYELHHIVAELAMVTSTTMTATITAPSWPARSRSSAHASSN